MAYLAPVAFDTDILRTSLADLDRQALIEIIIEQARKLHQQQAQLNELKRQPQCSAAPF